MQKAGYKDAGALLGGMAAWEAAGGEMVKADPTPPPAATPPAPPAQKPEAKPKKP